MTTAMTILDWKPMAKGKLLGFCKVGLPSGLVLVDCTVLAGERGPWVLPPSKVMVGKDGVALKDAGGKAKYTPVVEFTDKAIRDRFSSAVVEALRMSHPEVFA